MVKPSPAESRAASSKIEGIIDRQSLPQSGPLPKGILLETFPFELLSNILDNVDPVTVHSLSLTNRHFRNIFKTDQTPLTHCGVWLLSTRLEQDEINRLPTNLMLQRKWPFQKPRPVLPQSLSILNCALCKTKHHPSAFLGGPSRTRVLRPANEIQVLHQESLQRICNWHHGKLLSTVTVTSTKALQFGSWVSSMQELCLHCGMMQTSTSCACNSSSTTQGGPGAAGTCQFCPKISIRAYERRKMEGESKRIDCHFKRTKDGSLFAREKVQVSSKDSGFKSLNDSTISE